MPQLDPSSYASQLFWLLLIFGVLYLLMSRHLVPRIHEVLESRHTKIANDIDQAEILKEEARAAQEAHEKALLLARQQAGEMLAGAAGEIKKEEAARNSQLDETLARQLGEAEARIKTVKKRSMEKLQPVAAELAREIVAKLIHEEPDFSNINTTISSLGEKYGS